MAALLADEIPISAAQVVRAAEHGDAVSVQMLAPCGVLIGEVLATVVNCFNPSSIVVGGGLAHARDRLLAPMREAVYRRSLPLATRHLGIVRSSLELVGSDNATDSARLPVRSARAICFYSSEQAKPQIGNSRRFCR